MYNLGMGPRAAADVAEVWPECPADACGLLILRQAGGCCRRGRDIFEDKD